MKPRVLKFFFEIGFLFAMSSSMWGYSTIGLGFLHQCGAPLIITFYDFAIVLIIVFLFSLSKVCLPKTEQKLLIILFVSVLCFVWTTGPHDIGFLLAMSSSTGNGSTTSGFYRALDGHLYTYENCALWISRKSGNYGRRFLGCSQYNVRNNSIGVFHLN